MSESHDSAAATGPRPDPSMVYSGIRWSVNEIENLALEAYWKNPALWPDIQECLQDAAKCLYELTQRTGKDNCPGDTCDNGRCSPLCPEDKEA